MRIERIASVVGGFIEFPENRSFLVGDIAALLMSLQRVENPRLGPAWEWKLHIVVGEGEAAKDIRIDLCPVIGESQPLDHPIAIFAGGDSLPAVFFFRGHLFVPVGSPHHHTEIELQIAAVEVHRFMEVEEEKSRSSVDALLAELDQLSGLAPAKKEVRSLTNFLRHQRLRQDEGLPTHSTTPHLVFTGNPGTGKTTVARLLGRILRAMGVLASGQVLKADRSQLVGGYHGETAIKMSEVIEKSLEGVLYIDEAHSLVRDGPYGSDGRYGIEALDTLLEAMEGGRGRFVTIFAGSREPMEEFLAANPGLRSRFTRIIEFPDFSPSELLEIVKKMAQQAGYVFTEEACRRFLTIAERACTTRSGPFDNASYARTAFERACFRLADRLSRAEGVSRDDLMTIHADDLETEAAI